MGWPVQLSQHQYWLLHVGDQSVEVKVQLQVEDGFYYVTHCLRIGIHVWMWLWRVQDLQAWRHIMMAYSNSEVLKVFGFGLYPILAPRLPSHFHTMHNKPPN